MPDSTAEGKLGSGGKSGRSRVRILYMVSHLGSTGPNQQLLNIIKYMAKEEFEPIVLALSKSKGADLAPEFRNQGADVREPGPGARSLPGEIWRARKLAADMDPDVVHTHGIRSDLISALFLRRFKRVSTLRCNPYSDYGGRFGSRAGGALGDLHLAALRTLDCAVACSSSLSSLVEDRRGMRFPSIQNGVDTEKFLPPVAGGKKEMRIRLGLPLDKKVLLYAGALSAQKDPVVLMEAVDRMPDPEGVHLVLLGDGPLKVRCEEFGKGARFGFLSPGNVSNVLEYVTASDYFVSASHSEGLPNSVLEALAVGLPVCLSSIGPHLEILAQSPEVGTTAPVGDAQAFAKALGALLEKDHESLSVAASGLAGSRFSARKMSEDYMRIYRSLDREALEE